MFNQISMSILTFYSTHQLSRARLILNHSLHPHHLLIPCLEGKQKVAFINNLLLKICLIKQSKPYKAQLKIPLTL